MGFDECALSCRRRRLLVDQVQAALMVAVDSARVAGQTTVTLDEHPTPASRAEARAAHARADHAAQIARAALQKLGMPSQGDPAICPRC